MAIIHLLLTSTELSSVLLDIRHALSAILGNCAGLDVSVNLSAYISTITIELFILLAMVAAFVDR